MLQPPLIGQQQQAFAVLVEPAGRIDTFDWHEQSQ